MNRRLIIIPAVIMLCGAQAVFAQTVPADEDIPVSIRNNRFFTESVRLTILAQNAFDEGDFLASTEYSEEAVRFAALSDEFVRLQLKIRETDNAIAAARRRLDFAASVDAASRYPDEYSQAQASFDDARRLRAAEEWDNAIEAANQVLAFLAALSEAPDVLALPSQYTVRQWTVTRDSFWTIAGWPWVYNNPREWRRLYEANRSKLPEPGNPNLILPGMILDIPSIRGETRQGMWEPGIDYPPLP